MELRPGTLGHSAAIVPAFSLSSVAASEGKLVGTFGGEVGEAERPGGKYATPPGIGSTQVGNKRDTLLWHLLQIGYCEYV